MGRLKIRKRLVPGTGILLALIFSSVFIGGYLLPWWILVSTGTIALMLGTGFLAVHRWSLPFSHLFGGTVQLPVWAWLSFGTIGGLSLIIVNAGALTVDTAIWVGVVSISVSAVGRSLLIQRDSKTSIESNVPAWLGIVGVYILWGILWLYVVTASLFTPIFFLSFLAFFFFIWFIVPLAVYQRSANSETISPSEPLPRVSIIVPAYNEEGYIGRCLDHILASEYPTEKCEIVVIDDGSSDGTFEEAKSRVGPNITLHSKQNEGKHAALNDGLAYTTGEIVVIVDADSFLEPDALSKAVGTLQADSAIGGVAGNVRVVNRRNSVSRLQTLEYIVGINTFRRAFDFFGVIPVVPGCLGAFRREALADACGYDGDTLTEDFDVTIKVLKAGWQVKHTTATVWTEAPYSWRDLYRQRLRWNQGNIEVMLKHWKVFTEDGSGYLRHLVFPFHLITVLLAPLVTVAVVVAIGLSLLNGTATAVASMVSYFVFIGGLVAVLALRVEGESLRLVPSAIPLMILYPLFQGIVIAVSLIAVLRNVDSPWGSVRRMEQDPTIEKT